MSEKKVTNLLEYRDRQAMESGEWSINLPICGADVKITGGYATYYGQLNGYHINKPITIPDNLDWQEAARINNRVDLIANAIFKIIMELE